MLGLELRVRERGSASGFRELRFFDPIAGEDLRTHEEAECDREKERQGRIRAARAHEESEHEVARLRAMLERLPGLGAGDAPSDGA